MANAMYPFICIQKKPKSTVNIRGFNHAIMLKPRVDENPKDIEFAILGRNARHINTKSHRDENTNGRRPIRVLSAMKIKNPAIRIKMRGIATFSRTSEFIVFFFANVPDQATASGKC